MHIIKLSESFHTLSKCTVNITNTSSFMSGLGVGVNIAQLFSTYNKTPYTTYAQYTTQLALNDVAEIKSYGFTHIRIPITRTTLTTDLKHTPRIVDGHNFMELLRDFVLSAQTQHLKVIVSLIQPQSAVTDVDYNITTRLENNNGTDRNDVAEFCAYVIGYLDSYVDSNLIAYEIINEPAFYNSTELKNVYDIITDAIGSLSNKYLIFYELDGYSKPPDISDTKPSDNPQAGFSNHMYANYSEPGYGDKAASIFLFQGSSATLPFTNLEWPPSKTNVDYILAHNTLSSPTITRLTNYCGNGPDNFDAVTLEDGYYEFDKFKDWAPNMRIIITEIGMTTYAQNNGGLTWLNAMIAKSLSLNIPITLWSWNGDIFQVRDNLIGGGLGELPHP